MYTTPSANYCRFQHGIKATAESQQRLVQRSARPGIKRYSEVPRTCVHWGGWQAVSSSPRRTTGAERLVTAGLSRRSIRCGESTCVYTVVTISVRCREHTHNRKHSRGEGTAVSASSIAVTGVDLCRLRTLIRSGTGGATEAFGDENCVRVRCDMALGSSMWNSGRQYDDRQKRHSSAAQRPYMARVEKSAWREICANWEHNARHAAHLQRHAWRAEATDPSLRGCRCHG